MSKEEKTELFQKALKNTLEVLANNPKEAFNYLKLQEKYNNVLKEKAKLKIENKQLREKIKRVACNLGHELYGHILQNDEETYNEEFYTDGKLDYKKLLISLLEETFETLEVDGKKWWDYEN